MLISTSYSFGCELVGIEAMTSYVVNHLKKKTLLAKRERELVHALRNGFPASRLTRSAEAVRAAQLSVFKMHFSRTSTRPASYYRPEGEALEWQELSVEDVLDKYR